MPLSSGAVFAFLQSTPLFAQLSTSVTDDRIRMIIVALLVVAGLLAITTIWFFVHTSPRRRATPVVGATAGAHSAARTGDSDDRPTAASSKAGSPVAGSPVAGSPTPGSTPAGSSAGSSVVGSTAAPTSTPSVATNDDDDDDEWLRLTSPEKRSPAVDQNRPPV